MSNLYRKTALDKLSSPEQLDKMIKITPPMFWIGVSGGALIVAVAILWSVFARLPVKVESKGIFISDGTGQKTGSVMCYVPISDGQKRGKGMPARIYPTTVNSQEYGNISGTVTDVADYVTSSGEIKNELKDDSLVQAFTENGPVIMVRCDPYEDPQTESGYKWSSKKGGSVPITPGTFAVVDIVIEEKAPITMLIPLVKEKLSVQSENSPYE